MPALALAAGAAIQVIGILDQTVGGVKAAKAQATIAGMEAKDIREVTAAQETQDRRRSQFAIAKGVAMGASAGLDIGSGSPLLQELDNTAQAELQALNIRRSGQVRAMGKDYEATLAKARIPGIIFGGATAAAGSVLSSWMSSSGTGGGSGGVNATPWTG